MSHPEGAVSGRYPHAPCGLRHRAGWHCSPVNARRHIMVPQMWMLPSSLALGARDGEWDVSALTAPAINE